MINTEKLLIANAIILFLILVLILIFMICFIYGYNSTKQIIKDSAPKLKSAGYWIKDTTGIDIGEVLVYQKQMDDLAKEIKQSIKAEDLPDE